MIEEEFKNILSQDLTGALGTLQMREEEEEQEEEEQGDDIDEYTDEIQIPVSVRVFRRERNRSEMMQETLHLPVFLYTNTNSLI